MVMFVIHPMSIRGVKRKLLA